MLRYIVAVFVALAACSAAQIIEVPTCSLKTGLIIGYDYSTNKPVYQTSCSGLCLSIIKQPTVCRPSQYVYRSIRALPLWFQPTTITTFRTRLSAEVLQIPYLTRTVRLPSACSCLPAPCIVNGREYAHGAKVYNDCGDKCTCRYGQLVECCRQRKSIMHMPRTERLRFMQVLYDVSTGAAGAGVKAQYDALIADHETYFHSGIHDAGELLPWHRHFLLKFENILRTVDCRVTVPYYAWELTSANPWDSQLWAPSVEWYGGGTLNQCVMDGKWTAPWALAPSAGGGCLRRRRVGSVPSPMDVATLLATPAGSFAAFNGLLNSFHAQFHCSVDGTMCTLESANAPEFTLHHGNMDRLWAKWQATSPAHQTSFNAEIDTVMTPASLAGGITPRQVLDIKNHLGVCVDYVEPGFLPIFDIINVLAKLPQLTLLSIPAKKADLAPTMRRWMALHQNLSEVTMKTTNEAIEMLNGRPEAEQFDPLVDHLGVDPVDVANAIIELNDANGDQRINVKTLLLPEKLAILDAKFEQVADEQALR